MVETNYDKEHRWQHLPANGWVRSETINRLQRMLEDETRQEAITARLETSG